MKTINEKTGREQIGKERQGSENPKGKNVNILDEKSNESVNGQYQDKYEDTGRYEKTDTKKGEQKETQMKDKKSWNDQDLHKHLKKEIGNEREFQSDYPEREVL